jgi:hypothetical protein
MTLQNGATMARQNPYPARTAPSYPPKAGEHGAVRPGSPLNGARNGAANGAYDAATVIRRLEEAGRSLLCLPNTGYSTRLRTSSIDIVRTAVESYGWDPGRLRPAYPDPRQITEMDEALAWIPRIPRDRYVLRRIVGARALISPTTERHLFPWRRLASLLGADHKAIQRWHAQGIDLIVAILNSK